MFKQALRDKVLAPSFRNKLRIVMMVKYVNKVQATLIVLLSSWLHAEAKLKATTGDDFIGSNDGSTGIKALFNNVYSNFDQVALMIGGSAYIAGVVFVFAAMMKVKQHRDNPTQVPITTGLVFLMAGVGLIFLPNTLREGATTVFTSLDTQNTGVSDANITNNPWAK